MPTKVQPESLSKCEKPSSSTPANDLSLTSQLEIQTFFIGDTDGLATRRVFVDHTPLGAYQRSLSQGTILDEDQGPMGAD